MHFLIHAFDHKDAEAINRRLKAREKHLFKAREMHAKGEILLAGAMIDHDDKMYGSVVIVEMDSIEDVEAWLQEEVYLKEEVWDKVNIYPLKIALR